MNLLNILPETKNMLHVPWNPFIWIFFAIPAKLNNSIFRFTNQWLKYFIILPLIIRDWILAVFYLFWCCKFLIAKFDIALRGRFNCFCYEKTKILSKCTATSKGLKLKGLGHVTINTHSSTLFQDNVHCVLNKSRWEWYVIIFHVFRPRSWSRLEVLLWQLPK